MGKVHETIRFGDAASNAEKLGIIISWLVSHHLTEATFEHENASAIARLRMEDMSGAEFFATILNGEFGSAFLNQHGQDFVEDYFLSDTYEHDYNQVRKCTADQRLLCNHVYLKISEAYRKFVKPPSIGQKLAKVLRFR